MQTSSANVLNLTPPVLSHLKCFLVTFAATVVASLPAQNYHPIVEPGKLWSTSHVPCEMPLAFSRFEKFSADTTFSGYTWKTVIITEDSVLYGWAPGGFLREDSARRVYFTNPAGTLTYLFYDFGISVGDTVYPYNDPLFPYVLDSVTPFELLTGEIRNRYVLRVVDPYGGADSCYTYWIEGIGSLYGVLTPVFCYFVGDNPHLICAWEYDTLLFHNPDFTECWIIPGIREEGSTLRHLRVYPNPAREFLTIEFPEEELAPAQVALIDLLGNTRLVRPVLRSGSRINLKEAGISPGVYLFRIEGNPVGMATGRLIIIP
jgi:hypothetical protein